ncbi:putative ferric-chelate reductase 1 isoform X2 [Protopterus annectens]|uniref:putative ferric-chelate reductase 1 isoform X2 n=1 Tax=Protopterus annectens TaxID=7888 RepID=UPI001CFA95EA|nr:putative ferric-chelate reductase 1 isoform X2 [Protopterus annectens]
MEECVLFVVCVIFTTLLPTTSGYPNGRIEEACSTMEPIHGSVKSQSSSPPYSITVSNTTYTPGDKFTVTLEGLSGQQFTGFLLESVSVGTNEFLGTFTILDSKSQTLTCSRKENAAVSHTTKVKKQKIQFEWTAPSTSQDIQFKTTLLQSYDVFWSNIKGPVMKRARVTDPAATTSASNTAATKTLVSSSNPVSDNLQISSGGCGTSKFCFSVPADCSPDSNPDCFFMSSSVTGNAGTGTFGLKFELSGKSSGYIAVGLSDDKIMGADDIYCCGVGTNGKVQVQHAVSSGKTTPTTLPVDNIEIIASSFTDGVIKCSFIRRYQISTQQRAATDLFYVFFATGPFSGDQMGFHPRLPFITEAKVNISSFQVASGSASENFIIKAHGLLMLAAWMTAASIGMIMARHFKTAAKILIHGKAAWFQVHYGLMVVTVGATVIGFIMAFVSRLGWSYDKGAHPVIGCIVMILSLIQPFIAFFRPAPQANRRPLFNWFHRLNALLIKILAVACIFLGLELIDESENGWLSKVMGGFVGWEVLMFILLDGYQRFNKKEIEDEDKKVNKETYILVIYICGNVVFQAALFYGIRRG